MAWRTSHRVRDGTELLRCGKRGKRVRRICLSRGRLSILEEVEGVVSVRGIESDCDRRVLLGEWKRGVLAATFVGRVYPKRLVLGFPEQRLTQTQAQARLAPGFCSSFCGPAIVLVFVVFLVLESDLEFDIQWTAWRQESSASFRP
jgi:hypothetical protein